MYGRCFVGLCVKGGLEREGRGSSCVPMGFLESLTWLWDTHGYGCHRALASYQHWSHIQPVRALHGVYCCCWAHVRTLRALVFSARACVRERGRMKKRQIGICKCLVNLGCLLPPSPREPVQLDEYVESLWAAVAVRKVSRMLCSWTRQLPGVSRG